MAAAVITTEVVAAEKPLVTHMGIVVAEEVEEDGGIIPRHTALVGTITAIACMGGSIISKMRSR
jgi:hypothetical protein